MPGIDVGTGLLGWCLLLALGGTGCGGAMQIDVEVSHQIRCTFVRYRGTWTVDLPPGAGPIEQCRDALDRVLREWEGLR